MNTESAIERYLTTLRGALKGLPAPDCDEIVSEIGVHLRESVQQPGTNVETVISHLGPAKELAAQYRDTLLLQRTARAASPWVILNAALRLARRSALGFLCFVVALIGYGTGAAMILSAFAKLIFPKQVGLWIGPDVFSFGFHDPDRFHQGGIGLLLLTGTPAHEVLGWWYIPVALAIGALFVWATTKLVRKLVRHTKSRRPGPFLRTSYLGPIVYSCVLLASLAVTLTLAQSMVPLC